MPGAYHKLAFHRSDGGRRPADRHHPARAARQLRGARRPSRRRALPAAVRHHGAHAAVRRRGAGPRPPAGRARQGHRHRHDLHVRRHHRRHLVARAQPADARAASAATGAWPPTRRRGSPTDAGQAAYAQIAGLTPKQAQTRDRRAARASRASCSASRARSPTRSSSTNGRRGRSRSSPAASGTSATAAATTRCASALLERGERAALAPRLHAPPLRELGRGAQRRLADQPPALLRRADPAVVPARRRRRPDLRPAARPRRGAAADRPVDRRAPPASPRTSAASPAASSATPT